MTQETFPMTEEGKKRLEAELEDLKVRRRPEIIERIKIARGFGDLSENSEYESAKNEQSALEGQIAKLEHMIRYAEIIDPSAAGEDTVSIGKRVKFIELPDGEAETYEIVGKAEADRMNLLSPRPSLVIKWAKRWILKPQVDNLRLKFYLWRPLNFIYKF